jgi:hypothetical protein
LCKKGEELSIFMKIYHKLDKAFGPSGSIAGIILFLAGLATIWFSFSGIMLLLIGAFIGFSHTGTIVDVDRKRIRFVNYVFGIIPSGKWINITPYMKLGLKRSNMTWRNYSKGNRSIDIDTLDIRLILYDANHKEMMHVQKLKDRELAEKEIENLCNILNINKI